MQTGVIKKINKRKLHGRQENNMYTAQHMHSVYILSVVVHGAH